MKRILVVDDSIFMRTFIKNIFIRNGFQIVGEASNGREGVEQYKKLLPDLVTLDYTMDEMNGIDALKEIIRFNPDAVVFMVSAMGQKHLLIEAIREGAKGFIVKPFDEKRIIDDIMKL